jgi:hypothetical protein
MAGAALNANIAVVREVAAPAIRTRLGLYRNKRIGMVVATRKRRMPMKSVHPREAENTFHTNIPNNAKRIVLPQTPNQNAVAVETAGNE